MLCPHSFIKNPGTTLNTVPGPDISPLEDAPDDTKGVVTDGWLFPSASTLSTDRRVATQRTHPSLAVCKGVRKQGWTGGERHMVSSKTKSPETLGTLRKETGPPGFASQWLGSGPFSAQTGTVLGLASPPSTHHSPHLRTHHCRICRSPMLPQAC